MEIEFYLIQEANDALQLREHSGPFNSIQKRDWPELREDVIVEWTDPLEQNAFWDEAIHWIGRVKFDDLPSAVIGNILADFLWSIIEKLQTAEGSQGQKTTGETLQNKIDDKDVRRFMTVVFVEQGRQIEVDVETAKLESVKESMTRLIDGQSIED